MSSLRHPIRAIRESFGTAGLIVAVCALVLALGGTALAASGALTGKQKKEVEKIAKKYAGKPGATGATGPAGTNGTNGKDGANGTSGADGTNGKDGTSATTVSFSGNAHGCGEGGVEIKSAGATTFVCNGEEGEKGEKGDTGDAGTPGPAGEPWTPNSTLPPGATEAGSWAFNGNEDDTNGVRVPISFPIRFPFNVKEAHIHFGEPSSGGAFEAGGACPASSALNPQAAPGELCIYTNTSEGLENATYNGTFKYSSTLEIGTGRAGAMLKFTPTANGAIGAGSFALTGCTKTPVIPGEPNECPAGS